MYVLSGSVIILDFGAPLTGRLGRYLKKQEYAGSYDLGCNSFALHLLLVSGFD